MKTFSISSVYSIYKSCPFQSLPGEIFQTYFSCVSVTDFPIHWSSTVILFNPSVAGSRDTTSNKDVKTGIIQELVQYYT